VKGKPLGTAPGHFASREAEFDSLERYDFWSSEPKQWDPNNLMDCSTVGGQARRYYLDYITHVVTAFK
jgi:hypothetical protein